MNRYNTKVINNNKFTRDNFYSNSKNKIKIGSQIKLISGEQKGKIFEVIEVLPKFNLVRLEDYKLAKRSKIITEGENRKRITFFKEKLINRSKIVLYNELE